VRAAGEQEKLLEAQGQHPPLKFWQGEPPYPVYLSLAGCNFMHAERSLGGFAAATAKGASQQPPWGVGTLVVLTCRMSLYVTSVMSGSVEARHGWLCF
jgi:hypothetical protein